MTEINNKKSFIDLVKQFSFGEKTNLKIPLIEFPEFEPTFISSLQESGFIDTFDGENYATYQTKNRDATVVVNQTYAPDGKMDLIILTIFGNSERIINLFECVENRGKSELFWGAIKDVNNRMRK